MKVDSAFYTGSAAVAATGLSAAAAPEAPENDALAAALKEAENRDKILLSALGKQEEKKLFEFPEASKNSFDIRVGKPADNTTKLTQRLVAASNEMEVGSVIAEAGLSLTNLRIIAALGEGDDAKKAQAIIRKINRLLSRASGKIRDLRDEQSMRTQQKRAEERRQKSKAEKIKDDLRKKQKLRHVREGGYLRESLAGQMYTSYGCHNKNPHAPDERMDIAAEAAIAVQAEAIAAAEVAVEGGGGDFAGGGEVGVEAGSAGGEVASAGGMDISV